MVDMAHYAGLIAAGVYPNPVPHADVVTSTTHKSLRGPRGGIILMKAEVAKQINSAIFPGIQGGPLMHVIAAKAVAFLDHGKLQCDRSPVRRGLGHADGRLPRRWQPACSPRRREWPAIALGAETLFPGAFM